MMKTFGITLAIVGTVFLSGCQTAPKTMYQWGGYQPQVYQHFKGGSPEQQIIVLEKDLQVIITSGNQPPPGYFAHLALLYFNTGKEDQAIQNLQTEKKLFPESTAYMDFLLKNFKKVSKNEG